MVVFSQKDKTISRKNPQPVSILARSYLSAKGERNEVSRRILILFDFSGRFLLQFV